MGDFDSRQTVAGLAGRVAHARGRLDAAAATTPRFIGTVILSAFAPVVAVVTELSYAGIAVASLPLLGALVAWGSHAMRMDALRLRHVALRALLHLAQSGEEGSIERSVPTASLDLWDTHLLKVVTHFKRAAMAAGIGVVLGTLAAVLWWVHNTALFGGVVGMVALSAIALGVILIGLRRGRVADLADLGERLLHTYEALLALPRFHHSNFVSGEILRSDVASDAGQRPVQAPDRKRRRVG